MLSDTLRLFMGLHSGLLRSDLRNYLRFSRVLFSVYLGSYIRGCFGLWVIIY
jgi:hypothetical protein